MRAIAICFLVLAGASGAAGQELQFGVKAGASVASVTQDAAAAATSYDYDPRTGMTGGVFGLLPMHRALSLQLEALLTDRGGTLPLHDPNLLQGSVASRLRFQYLDAPVLVRLNGPRAGAARLHVFAGPTFSLRISGRRQLAYSAIGSFGYEDDISDDLRRFDVGATVGGGADLGTHFLVDARYSFGLREAIRDPDTGSLKNRGFQAMVGFRLLTR